MTRARVGSKFRTRVVQVDGQSTKARQDVVATEEPLEVRLIAGGETRTVAVTMRTPGADFELAAGFLHAEGIISQREEIARISYCVTAPSEQRYNIVNVTLRSDTMPQLDTLERHFFVTSACGVCGKASLEALHARGLAAVPSDFAVTPELVTSLPEKLRQAQGLFDLTGGLHAAALFDAQGNLSAVREDVGRHNALDKLIGWALLEGGLPLEQCVVMLSGRASYELLQKALVARLPVACSVSAPSSLAVSLAREFGVTLIGFLRGERFNVYAGKERLVLARETQE